MAEPRRQRSPCLSIVLELYNFSISSIKANIDVLLSRAHWPYEAQCKRNDTTSGRFLASCVHLKKDFYIKLDKLNIQALLGKFRYNNKSATVCACNDLPCLGVH